MVKATALLMDVFSIIILLIAFTQSTGIINPVAQTLLKSHTFVTVTHYQMIDTYGDLGLAYFSKAPIPAGYTLILYDSSHADPSKQGKAYLRADGAPSSSLHEIGIFDHTGPPGGGTVHSIQGPGWIIIKTATDGTHIVNYKSSNANQTLMPSSGNKMPFQDTLMGYGKALSNLTNSLYP